MSGKKFVERILREHPEAFVKAAEKTLDRMSDFIAEVNATTPPDQRAAKLIEMLTRESERLRVQSEVRELLLGWGFQKLADRLAQHWSAHK
jgi:hypothetical protein